MSEPREVGEGLAILIETEIYRLRAALEEAKLPSPDEAQRIFREARLRAEIEALREAGEGLAALLVYAQAEGVDVSAELAAWRKVGA